MLRPNTIDARASVNVTRPRFERQLDAAFGHENRLAFHGDSPFEQIHRRRPDKTRDEKGRRLVVEFKRGAHLLHHAVAHDHDSIGHRHRLDLVVRHIDRRSFQALMQFLDFRAHLHTQLSIQI